MKIDCYCIICGKYIGKFYPSHKRETCSKECLKKRRSQLFKGENNPRFVDGRCLYPKYCICGRQIDRRSEKCPKCAIRPGHIQTIESKEKIGKKSKAKFTNEYKLRIRKTMEDNGHWVPLKDKTKYQIYFEESNWNKRMFDIESIQGQDKLKQYGIFNNIKNSKGVVRDHRLSRKTGFELKIPPAILRHPANCEILLHSENIAKKKARYIDNDSISADELFFLIKNYNENWHEQELCLTLIKEYKQGKRHE